MRQVSYDDLKKVEIYIGKIIKVKEFLRAKKPAYKLWIDFGDLGIKKSSVQITKFYEQEELIN